MAKLTAVININIEIPIKECESMEKAFEELNSYKLPKECIEESFEFQNFFNEKNETHIFKS